MPPRKTSGKVASIDLRASPEEKQEWEEWAELMGRTLSGWLREAAEDYLAKQRADMVAKLTVKEELAGKLKGRK